MYFYMRSKFSLIQIGFVSNVPNQLILMKFQTMRWLLNLGKEEEVFRNMALISSHSLEIRRLYQKSALQTLRGCG